MIKKNVIYILSTCLIINLIFALKYKKEKDSCIDSLKNLENAYKESIISQYKGWQISRDSLEDVLLINQQRDSCNLYSQLSKFKIIFYYTNKMCEPCVEKELKNLSDVIKDIGIDKILIINKTLPSALRSIEYLPTFKNVWCCNKNILKTNLPEEVPLIILIYDKKIINICYTNKSTNYSSQYFYLFIKNISKEW